MKKIDDKRVWEFFNYQKEVDGHLAKSFGQILEKEKPGIYSIHLYPTKRTMIAATLLLMIGVGIYWFQWRDDLTKTELSISEWKAPSDLIFPKTLSKTEFITDWQSPTSLLMINQEALTHKE